MKRREQFIFHKGVISADKAELVPVSTEELIRRIKSCDKVEKKIVLLRKVLRVDSAAYKRQKTKLPFFIGASFEENIRRMENLQAIYAFILDIDNCFQDLPFDADLIGQLKKDNRIFIMFRSPSGKGLKVVFILDKPIETAKVFSDFYRRFVYQFSRQYKMEEFVDTVTSDVTRVCFFSFDPDVWYRPDAVPVQSGDYISGRERPESQDDKNLLPEGGSQENKEENESDSPTERNSPNKEQYREILKKLGNRRAGAVRQKIEVPPPLDEMLPYFKAQLDKYEFKLDDETNIQYGKKVKVSHAGLWAELNVYYGKKGFSVVESPRQAADPDLSRVVARLAGEAIAEYWLNQRLRGIEIEESIFRR